MNTIVTSRAEILKASRELIRQEGWSAISIRSVAAACGVSVGSIYNYFDSKTELVSATVESLWEEIFHRPENAEYVSKYRELHHMDV
ncbi:MAG: TetR/AcrR family transcriptional regulator [Christensenellales bacterium]